MNSFHGTIPSENWDDDFEFQPSQTKHTNANAKTKHANDHAPNRMSIASSDWDAVHDEDEDDDDEDEDKQEMKTSTILEDKKNLTQWADTASITPQTPTKRTHTVVKSTENWDDDFEDSPLRSQRTSPRSTFPPPPQAKSPSKHTKRKASRPESWDDEFGGPAANKNKSSPGRGLASPESSDDELEMGYARGDIDGEEDRTVTARSRRAALSRLTSNANTPPPPMPALPLPFLEPSQVFPRSPTASVFSIPTQRPPSSTSTTYLRPTMSRSSTRLDALPPSPPIHRERERRRLRKKSRPVPQGAIEMSNLSRRRDEDHVFEEEEGEEEGGGRRSVDSTSPRSPEAGTSYDSAGPSSIPAGSLPVGPVPPSTPNGKGGALLSRIGSVKKWGVRRKRGGSVTPGEVVGGPGSGVRIDTDPSSGYHLENDVNLTPRPRPHSQASSSFPSSSSESHSSTNHHSGSASSHHYHTRTQRTTSTNRKRASTTSPGQLQSQSSNSNWFFRSSSSPLATSGNESVPFGLASGNSSSNNLPGREYGKDSREFPRPRPSVPPPETPTKLLKRKSLGFVQLRRGFGGHGDDPPSGSGSGDGRRSRDDKEKSDEKGKRPASMVPQPRHASYGGLGMGRAGANGNGNENGGVDGNAVGGGNEFVLSEHEKERLREAERDRDRDKEKEREKEKEGSRGFMGSVRKISLVGRHKRTKSGVSLSGVEELAAVRQPRSSIPPTPHLYSQEHLRDHPDRERTPQPKHFNSVTNSPPLLPPIELQPPSPPRVRPTPVQTQPMAPPGPGIENMLSPSSSSASSLTASPTSPSAVPRRTKTPGSPQAASLGRSTIGPAAAVTAAPPAPSSSGAGALVPRRNSLGDLKIPDRISQAQVGLRRDLGMVREFAANVEQLKELQTIYHALVREVQGILDNHMLQSQSRQQAQPRPISPNFLRSLSRPSSRHRSHTNTSPPSSSSPLPPSTAPTNPNSYSQMAIKQLASAFYTINSKYRISWECAELLIELGGGSSGDNEGSSSAPPTSVSAPVMHGGQPEVRKVSRERAVTLAGDESKPPTPVPGATSSIVVGSRAVSPPLASPPSLAWRASTGRHDLSHRQLVLLKEMLNNADTASAYASEDLGSRSIPEESFLPSPVMLSVNRDWRWGDAMSSTVTLPSEDSSLGGVGGPAAAKKRRSSKLGMSGLRDMLRSLKRSHSENPPLPATMAVPSSTSLSTDNSSMDHRYPHPHVPPSQGRRRAKTSSGPESVRLPRPTSPYNPSSLTTKPSPRRPSLASIFRLGQKSKTASPTGTGDNSETDAPPRSAGSRSASGSSVGEEEDWDRLDSASDLDAAARALGIMPDGSATVRGKGLGRSPYLQESLPPPLPGYPIRPLTPKRSASGSQSSLWGGDSPSQGGTPPQLPQLPPPSRSTRLSNVEEHEDGPRQVRSSSKGRHSRVGVSPSRPSSRGTKNGSVRSMPPQMAPNPLPDPKLAMTPENIKPLLENAKDVHARLNECIAEIRSLLSMHAS